MQRPVKSPHHSTTKKAPTENTPLQTKSPRAQKTPKDRTPLGEVALNSPHTEKSKATPRVPEQPSGRKSTVSVPEEDIVKEASSRKERKSLSQSRTKRSAS